MLPDAALAIRGPVLWECLGELQERWGTSRRGIEERAVFELRHRVYVDPERVCVQTRELLTAENWRRVQDEFRESHEALRQLVLEDIPSATADCRDTSCELEKCRLGLDSAEYKVVAIDRLRREADKHLIGDLEGEMRSPGEGVQGGRRRLELEYMLAHKRHTAAARRLEELRCKLVAFEEARKQRGAETSAKEWVRVEDEVAELMGMAQARVARRLASAREFLRRCVGEKGRAAGPCE
jgi:hypothetical protein